jgi:four helix bundle protein
LVRWLCRHGTATSNSEQGTPNSQVHKLKVAMKELRETWLKIIARAGLIKPANKLQPLQQETNELISILFRSIETAKRNARKSPEVR